jgi:hypothetical protein
MEGHRQSIMHSSSSSSSSQLCSSDGDSIRRYADGDAASKEDSGRLPHLYMFARLAPSTPAPETGLLGAHLLVGLDGLDVLVRLKSLHRALREVHSVSLLVLFSS